jgi:MATE family multidrug resistance protein
VEGAAVAFACYWCVGVPLAVLLGFWAGLGVEGLWLALLVASALGCTAMAVFMSRLDWEKEAVRIAARVADEELEDSSEVERLLPRTGASDGV